MISKNLIFFITLVIATGCAQFTVETDGKKKPAEEKAAKLTADDCVDPDLSLLATGQSITLCDGTQAEGTFDISNLTAANIKSGVSIAGVEGSYAPDRGDWDMQSPFAGAGYFASVSNLPTAAEICDTTTFNGAAGSANCGAFQGNVASGIHRDKGGTPAQMMLAEELAAGSMNSLYTAGYREVPLISKDDDGLTGSSVTKVTRGTNEWNAGVDRKACGMGIATVADRVTDCNTQYSTKPGWDASSSDGKISWNGAVNGNASEGSWTLVTVYMRGAASGNGTTCNATCREVWRDDRTGLLWSDQLGDLSATANQGRFNWCKAAGSSNRAGSPYAEDDPINYCDNAIYQSQATPTSLCVEDATYLLTPTGITDSSTYEFDNPKGGMRAAANYDVEGDSPSIYWRLPTVYDWNQANLNGVRQVLPRMTGGSFWSASVYSDERNNAWFFVGLYGSVYYYDRTDDILVRCVGR